MKLSWRRIREIVRKEIRQTLREPRMRMLLLGPPMIQLIIFGYAVNLDVQHSRLAWMDGDCTPASRELLASFQGSTYFEIVSAPSNEAEAQRLLDRGEAVAVLRVLPGFARRIERGERATVQVLIDGANSNTAAIVSGYIQRTVAAHAARLAGERQRVLLAAGVATGAPPVEVAMPAVRLSSRVWFNPELESRQFFVPGVVVNIITLVTMMLTALAVVREKELGTIEQLMVTPIRPIELMLGKTLPFAAVGLIQMALVTLAALVIFNVPLRGSPLLLVSCAALFLLTTLGSGLLVSTISGTQQQAMMVSFFFFMPSLMLSGFAFPIRNMPVAVQWLTYLNPVRYFMEVVRGLFLKGVGVGVLWPQMLCMLAFGVAVLWLSAARFHKRLD